ncbi:MAG: serine hydrolase domain-containing protein [Bacteroidota bacterium]
MRRLLFIALICSLALSCRPTDELRALTPAEQIEYLAQGTIGLGTQQGLSIAIYEEGEWLSFHYGLTDVNRTDAPNDTTLYAIGEIGETFTATLLADAVLSSSLSFEDSLLNRWPETVPSFDNSVIRLHDLATHSAGLPAFPDASLDDAEPQTKANYFQAFREADLYSLLASQDLTAPPGLNYEAAPLGMVVLAHLLELRSNQSYFELLQQNILLSNNLRHTRDLLNLPQSLADRISPAWDITARPLPHYQFGEYQGSQSLYSSLADMRSWAEIQLDGFHPLSDAVNLCLQSHFVLDSERSVGYGWLRIEEPRTTYFFKEGAVHHASHLRVSPQSGQALIILSNTDHLPEVRWMADQIWAVMGR